MLANNLDLDHDLTAPDAAPPIRAFVLLGHGFGVKQWRERWKRGAIPGINEERPYGYHHAESDTCKVTFSEDLDEGKIVHLVRLGLRKIAGFDFIHIWRNRKRILAADVVWTHTELEHLALLLFLRMAGPERRPKVIAQSVWLFDRWWKLPRFKRRLFHKLMQSADVLTTCSPDNFRVARKLFLGRVAFVRFGINIDSMEPPRHRRFHYPMRIVSFGNDIHRDWVTLAKVVAGRPEFEVRIVSRHADRQLSALPNVTVIGAKSAAEVQDLYRWADVSVVTLKPNLHVSGITSVSESIVMGVPVICTDTGGMRSYVGEREVYYVPADDPEALIKALQRLSTDDAMSLQSTKSAQDRLRTDRISSVSFANAHKQLSDIIASETTSLPPHFTPQLNDRILVLLGHGFGARQWQERWRRGDIPGINEELPYGYHHARSERCQITHSEDVDEATIVRVIRLGLRKMAGFDFVHIWRNREKIMAADVVWTHTELEHLALLLFLRLVPRERRPKVIAQSVWLLDRWSNLSRLKRRIFRNLMRQADVLTVQSPANLGMLRQLFPSQKVELTKFGIAIDSMETPKHRRCHKPLRVVSFGNDIHRDWPTLIEAVAGRPEFEVRIASRQIDPRRIGHAPNICVLQPRSAREVEELYRWADVSVVPLKPNLHASGITSVAESIVMGVPVICTDTGGMRAYFGEREICYVPLHDREAMLGALERLSKDDNICLQSVKSAQCRIRVDQLTSRARAMRLSDLSSRTHALQGSHGA